MASKTEGKEQAIAAFANLSAQAWNDVTYESLAHTILKFAGRWNSSGARDAASQYLSYVANRKLKPVSVTIDSSNSVTRISTASGSSTPSSSSKSAR